MNRIIMSVITVALLVLGLGTANASTRLMEIGRSPFHQPPLTTVDTLQAMVVDQDQDVKKGFEKAGNPELYEPFVAQLPSAEIEKVDFQKGSWFEWMFFKKKGKGAVRVAKDVTWVNEKPFQGFKFDIDHEGQRYTFGVPLGCGNIALMGVQPVPVVVPPPVAVVPPPPVAVEEEPVVAAPVVAASPFRFIVDAGYYRQFDPAHYLFGRVGLEYVINEQFSVLGLVGGAPKIEGYDGASAFTADLLGEYSFGSRYYVDLGVGGWITDGDDSSDDPNFDPRAEDSQFEAIAGFGARVYGEPEDVNASLFVEIRSAFDELGQLYDYGRFGVGVRVRF
ncbi:hypothetical protein [Desulforhopalus sp. 52FAK]